MTAQSNEETARNKQIDLIKNILLLLNAYKQKVDKTIAKMNKAEDYDDSDSVFVDSVYYTDIHLRGYLDNKDKAFLMLKTLTNKLQNSKDQRTREELLDNVTLVDELKKTIAKMDQLARNKCLPTRLDKIYEAIKTLLRDLIALFVPLSKSTQTLTSTRSSLFSEIKTLKKSLNSPVSEPQKRYR